MKSKIILVASLLCAALFMGCASSAALNNLRIGMTKDQVISIMGQPDSMSAQGNVEDLTYYLLADSGQGRDQPYMVRMVDGKVESFGRLTQLNDMYIRPVTSNGQPGTLNYPPGMVTGTAVATPQAAASVPDLAAQIQKLKELKDQGVLTDEEFQKAKAKLLSDQK